MTSQPPDPPAGLHRAFIFQSYGWKDAADVAARLKRDLEAHGYDIWMDIERIAPGESFPQKIEEAIRRADMMLALLSPHSVRLSGDPGNDGGASVCNNELLQAHGTGKPILPVVVVPCETPWILNILPKVDLTRWAESQEAYDAGLRELVASIAAISTEGRSLYIPQLQRLRALDFTSELVHRSRDFTGRDWLFSRIAGWVSAPSATLVVEGAPGTGKSAFVAELVRRNPEDRLLAYHFCMADRPLTLRADEFVRSMAAMIGGRIPTYRAHLTLDGPWQSLIGEACAADPLTAFVAGVLQPLRELGDQPTRFIVVDGLDEAAASRWNARAISIPRLLAQAAAYFPPWLKLLVLTRPDAGVAPLFQDAERLLLADHAPEQRDDVRRYLAEQFAGGSLAALAAREGPDGIALIEARSAGNFLYAQKVLFALSQGSLAWADVGQLPRGLAALYHAAFSRALGQEERAEAEVLLGLMAAAREPLSAAQLAQAGGIDVAKVRAFLARLAGHVAPVDGAGGMRAFTLFHKSLADWLVAPPADADDFKVDVAAAQRRLLAFARDWRSQADGYGLRHLVPHLLGAGRTDDALGEVEAGFFPQRAARLGAQRLDLDDACLLALALMEEGREDAVAGLATTDNPWQRDGVAAALLSLAPAARPAVDRIAGRLLKLRAADPAEPSAEVLNARRVAIRAAEAFGLSDRLSQAARDPAAAVRILLAPMIHRYWMHSEPDGWALLDRLAAGAVNRLGIPDGPTIETIGHVSLAILAQHRQDEARMVRLLALCRGVAARIMTGPAARVLGHRLTLTLLAKPLAELLKRQPAYQPMNFAELAVTFARPDAFRAPWARVVDSLEQPELGFAPAVEALMEAGRPFDLYLMLAAERALIFHGARDPDAAFDVLERLFQAGCPWFRQSVLYVLFHLLSSRDEVEDAVLARYAALTEAFFDATRATLETSVALYSFAPHLAWVEIVCAQHRPGRAPVLLPRLLTTAIAEKDAAALERLFKAIDLMGFAYGRRSLAASLVAHALKAGGEAVEARAVEALVNIRAYDQPVVDEVLAARGLAHLRPRVAVGAPTVKGEDVPTWIDGFVVQSMLSSDAFRLQLVAALRRAAGARSVSEFLAQIVLWVTGMLAEGEVPSMRNAEPEGVEHAAR